MPGIGEQYGTGHAGRHRDHYAAGIAEERARVAIDMAAQLREARENEAWLFARYERLGAACRAALDYLRVYEQEDTEEGRALAATLREALNPT